MVKTGTILGMHQAAIIHYLGALSVSGSNLSKPNCYNPPVLTYSASILWDLARPEESPETSPSMVSCRNHFWLNSAFGEG